MPNPTTSLQFCEWERRNVRLEQPAYRVLVFEPKGMYPSGTRFVPNGFFHADEKLVFSVVLSESWHTLDPDAPFSEFDWASPQELRLLTSLVLCERAEGAYVRLYPIVRFGPVIDVDRIDLGAAETVQEVKALLLRHVTESGPFGAMSSLSCCKGASYDLVDAASYSFADLLSVWTRVVPPNHVLMRGVYALIKSDMLSSHYEFSEEAVTSLYIALDASFSMISRRLAGEGVKQPSAHDAAMWVHAHFDAPYGLPPPGATDRYFGEFYEQRVMTLHPASRRGDVPYSPSMHDDIPHLRRALRQIFTYLVLGRHDQGYLEAVSEFRRVKGLGMPPLEPPP